MGVEQKRFLLFLEVFVTRLPNGHLGHSVYRKPGHTGRYRHASSHHHPTQKHSIISSARFHFLISLCFKKNCVTFTAPSLMKDLNQKISKPSHRIYNSKTFSQSGSLDFLSHVEKATDRIVKILRKNNTKPIVPPMRRISQTLPAPKDPLPCNSLFMRDRLHW